MQLQQQGYMKANTIRSYSHLRMHTHVYYWIMGLSLMLLTSCGFKPRGSGFERLSGEHVELVSENPYGSLERRIMEKFRNFSIDASTTYLDKSADHDIDKVVNSIQILTVEYSKEILSVDATGRPAEYDSIINVDVVFHLTDREKQFKHFIVQRDYRFENTNSLAHDGELVILTKEMLDDLGERIVSQFLSQVSKQQFSEPSTLESSAQSNP